MSLDPQQSTGYEYHGDEIAVVGLAIRVPGANDPWTFWDNLAQGQESFQNLSDEEVIKAGADPALINHPRFVKVNASLNNIGDFDARFFGLSPFDASLMDPQYRHFLEMVWETFESAGEDPHNIKGTVGVYAGSGQNTYLMHHLMSQRKLMKSPGAWYLRHVGNDKDFMSTLASYHFDLKGPSINIQTACSTSLVATHLATQALVSRECDLAIAGGITIDFPQGKGYLAPENGIEDPRGQCRSYDASSAGTVFGSGGGAVLLKRYEDAVTDGNHVFAVIKASAVSNDGGQKAGFTAPSVDGQASAILEALELGGINPETIGYVEGHGTATPIGDPIEVEALTTAWRSKTNRQQFAALSSVKSNVGHLDAGAGVVSLIKAIGAVSQGYKYPTVHFKKPNPAFNIEQTPFYVSGRLEEWTSDVPRRAAISSLGVGGTNAHVIIEQVKNTVLADTQHRQHPLYVPFSAKSPRALKNYLEKFLKFLEDNKTLMSLEAIVKTLDSRRSFDYRAIIGAHTTDELIVALKNPDQIVIGIHGAVVTQPKKIAFAFTGQGTQYFNIGRDLYHHNSDYQKAFDQCSELLKVPFGQDIRHILFNDNPNQEEQLYLDRIDVTHPVLFSVAYALAQAWMAKGITPDAMIGHSLGEYVAATIAGVFNLEEVLNLICIRGRLMQSTPEGVMLSIAADESELVTILNHRQLEKTLSIAGVNVKGMSVVAGDPDAAENLTQVLEEKGISVKPLRISRASHSVLMDSILDEYQAAVARCKMQPASIPIVSNLDGQWLKPEQSANPVYWREHLRQAVRFADGADTLMQETKGYLFIEIGPGQQLTRLLEAHPSRGNRHGVISSLPGPKDAIDSLTWFNSGNARAWTIGAADLKNTFNQNRTKIHLPTYAWDHQNLMIEHQKKEYLIHDEIEKLPIEDWYSIPSWAMQTSFKSQDLKFDTKPLCLCFTDYLSSEFLKFSSALSETFEVICILRSDIDAKISIQQQLAFKVNGSVEKSYVWLMEQLFLQKPTLLEHLKLCLEWIDKKSIKESSEFYMRQRQYFHQTFYAVKALSGYQWSQLTIAAIGQEFLPFYDKQGLNPMKTLVQGPIRSFAAEQENLKSVFIDIDDAALNSKAFYKNLHIHTEDHSALLNNNSHVLQMNSDEYVYRGEQCFKRTYQKQNIHRPNFQHVNQCVSQMKKGGIYLISGLGDLALVVADYIVNHWQAVPIFIGRRQFPQQHQWSQIAASPRIDAEAQRIKSLHSLLQKEPRLHLVSADITNSLVMKNIMTQLKHKYGNINGVFHTAGLLDDQLLQLKTDIQAESILAPKVEGLEFYSQLQNSNPLDFILLFSSISAFTGMPGQSDYAAANGFMAAWARQQQAKGVPAAAVLWGIWSEVGMAAQAAIAQGIHSQVLDFKIGMLEACHQIKGPHGIQYQCYGLITDQHWILDNHRTLQGLALFPGTGYIDLFAQAMIHLTGTNVVTLNQVSFQAPLGVASESQVLIGLIVEQTEELKLKKSYQLKLVTGISLEQLQMQQFDTIHVTALASIDIPYQQVLIDLEMIRAVCPDHQIYAQNSHPQIQFGRDWQVLSEAWYGDQEALLRLEITHVNDRLQQHPWHPGMLDLAIGAQNLMDFNPQDYFYVPMFYESIVLNAPLESEVYSHVRLKSEKQAPELAVFDITLYNRIGKLLVQVKGFHLKRSNTGIFDLQPVKSSQGEINLFKAASISNLQDEDVFAQTLHKGIKPQEGQRVIHSVLQLDSLPADIVVSSISLNAYGQKHKLPVIEQQHLQARPHLSVAYAEPVGNLEIVIAELWGQALGLEKIGRDDQFFELGGHSLLLIQIIAQLKRRIDAILPMAQLFDTSTVAQWADIIGRLDHKKLDQKQTLLHDSQEELKVFETQSPVKHVSRQEYLNR